MQTVLFETASIVNSRPIGRMPTDAEDGTYLSPNDLILSRSSSLIPHDEYSNDRSPHLRFRFVQNIISAFWEKWQRDFFPSLLIRQKRHTARRNVKVGDIVIIQDSGMLRGKWKMGRVVEASPSLRDGFVRNVQVTYRNPNHTANTTVTRAVQRLIVLGPVDDV